MRAGGWDRAPRPADSHDPPGREVKGGAMDDREDEEEEEEETSPSCFPREDSCDTGERGGPGRDRVCVREPRSRRQQQRLHKCHWQNTKAQHLSGAF